MELNWANALRAWCMLGVYLWHSETFCGGDRLLTPYISPVCMAAFFFVSGFFFFRRYAGVALRDSWPVGMSNIFFRLVVPTVIFATLLYVPKSFYHHSPLSAAEFCGSVLGGTAFWFTSALVLMQLLALLLLGLMGNAVSIRTRTLVLVLLSLCLWVGFMQIDAPFNAFPWSYTSAMRYFLFFAIGGCCSRCERLNGDSPRVCAAAWAILLLLPYVALSCSIGQPQAFLDHVLRLLAALVGVPMLLLLSRCAPLWRWQTFMGRNTIVFYFLCGLLPAVSASLCRLVGLEGNAAMLPTFFLSIVTAWGASWLVKRYFPALFDLRKLWC